MDLTFSAQHESFREEVRAFLDEKLTPDLRRVGERQTAIACPFEPVMKWHRILYEKGWVAPSWPKEYGGTGWDEAQKYIFASELANADAPPLLPNSLGMVGPVVLRYGTEEQKQRYLPKILSGEETWAQGYSEPGAGSDLASLKTKAESDGDHYIINGTKIWTTYAQYADLMFCLVRTSNEGKPQEGITFLLFDMKTPGISISPIITLGGDHEVNQVFFDNVRVPKSGRLGEENMGWTYAKYLLEFERGAGVWSARARGEINRARRILNDPNYNAIRDAERQELLRKAAQLEIQAQAMEMQELRIMSVISRGGSPGPESSIMKVAGTELMQATTTLTMKVLGTYALPFTWTDQDMGNEPPVGPDYAAPVAPHYFNTRAASIYAGSNEIQRDIIAKRVLGL